MTRPQPEPDPVHPDQIDIWQAIAEVEADLAASTPDATAPDAPPRT